jgi:hypothetical protein
LRKGRLSLAAPVLLSRGGFDCANLAGSKDQAIECRLIDCRGTLPGMLASQNLADGLQTGYPQDMAFELVEAIRDLFRNRYESSSLNWAFLVQVNGEAPAALGCYAHGVASPVLFNVRPAFRIMSAA